MLRVQSVIVLIWCLAVLLAGCGPTPPPGPERLPTVPAAGTVTYQGNPLANASLSFQHSDGVVAATGKSDDQGRFTLSTYGANDGAPVGTYNVTVAVSAVEEIEPGVLAPEPEGGFRPAIPTKYANPATSGLTAEIPEGGKQDLQIELR